MASRIEATGPHVEEAERCATTPRAALPIVGGTVTSVHGQISGMTAWDTYRASVNGAPQSDMLTNLAAAGLSREDADWMGAVEVVEEFVREVLWPEAARRLRKHKAYKISNGPHAGRIRFLDGKNPKYLAYSSDGRHHPYLPPHPDLDWPKIKMDAYIPLVFVEAEKSAAVLAKHGRAAIGLGGCWGGSDKRHGNGLNPDITGFNLEGRPVLIALDSDVATNGNVLGGLYALARELSARGARVEYLKLDPQPDGAKSEPADIILAGGIAAFDALDRLTFEITRALWQQRDRYGLLTQNPAGVVVDILTGNILRKDAYLTVANNQTVLIPDAIGKPRAVSVGNAYLRWPYRREYTRLSYAPGQPRDPADGSYNLWGGFGCEAIEGDATPFVFLLHHVLGSDLAALWAIRWLAYPIQHPGTKMMTGLLVRGKPSTGKSLLFAEAMRMIHGADNSSVIGKDQLRSNFNRLLVNKTYVVGEEIANESEKRLDGNKVKHVITGDTSVLELKGIDAVEVPNRAVFVFLSNSKVPLYLESDDRRIQVVETGGTLSFEAGREFKRWLQNGGAEIAHHYLKHLDLGDFDPTAPAPMTAAKLETQAGSRSAYETWSSDLMSDPARPAFCTADELGIDADNTTQLRRNPTSLRSALLNAGAIEVGRTTPDPKARTKAVTVWQLVQGELPTPTDYDSRRAALIAASSARDLYFRGSSKF